MRLRNILFFFLTFVISSSIYSQIAPGQWSDHLPYTQGLKVVSAQDNIYCVSQYGLFYYNKKDNSVNKFSKINGLTDIYATNIAYSEKYNTMVVAYSDANIDIVSNNKIVNIAVLKNNSTISNKIINKILIIDNYAYLCCGFGIIMLDIVKFEIKETYYIRNGGINVNDLCTDSTYFYAATSVGIFKGLTNDPDLFNYADWTLFTDAILTQNTGSFINIKILNNNVYALFQSATPANDNLFVYSNNSWTTYSYPFTNGITEMNVSNNNLTVISNQTVYIFDSKNNLVFKTSTPSPMDVYCDNSNLIWVADNQKGLVKIDKNNNNIYIAPAGPPFIDAYSVDAYNGVVWVTAGSKDAAGVGAFNWKGIYSCVNGVWEEYYDSKYSPTNRYAPLDNCFDFCNILINPLNPSIVYAAPWSGNGLIEITNDSTFTVFNQSTPNCTLKPITNFNYRLYGLSVDKANNLWISSSLSVPLTVKESNGSWTSFMFNNMLSGYNIGSVLMNRYGQIWMCIYGHGLFVFNDNNTINTTSDDQYELLSVTAVSSNGTQTFNNVNTIAEDTNGYIWVGTNNGPVVYYNPQSVFTTTNFNAEQVLIPRNNGTNLADILLNNVQINVIKIDGANRKWMGTHGYGAFLLSGDGTQQLLNFTAENSPLLSDIVLDLSIDQKTGEIYFVTDKGIISYRGVATEGNNSYTKVYAYPNPVRDGYEGDIIITGLISESNVKITDISGNLIYETTSLGGQAVWNGRNFSGRKVQTGVYLVFINNSDGSQSIVTKILFIH